MNNPSNAKFGIIATPRVILSFLFIALFSVVSFAQSARDEMPQAESSVAYVKLGGNPSCATLNASSNPLFAHIMTNDEFKLDFGTPNGTFAFTHDPSKSLTISSSMNPSRINSFTSQVTITAVIIKTGSDSYVFPYSGGTSGDTNLNTGETNAISHVSFCYGVTLVPSAGEVSVSGRVTDSFGRGIAGAKISVGSASNGGERAATILTNQFGYYTVSNLNAGETYVAIVSHRRFQFTDNVRAFTLNEDLAGNDFVANP